MPTPLKILYVEDNALVREVTTELLAQEQRQIVACADAEQALREFRENPVDVVITDVGPWRCSSEILRETCKPACRKRLTLKGRRLA